jgi:hypothetical protein
MFTGGQLCGLTFSDIREAILKDGLIAPSSSAA